MSLRDRVRCPDFPGPSLSNERIARGLGLDADDGCREVHVNTLEGFRSLPPPRLGPHRGTSREDFPLDPGPYEFVQTCGSGARR